MALDSYIGARGNLLAIDQTRRSSFICRAWSCPKRRSRSSPRSTSGSLRGTKLSTLFSVPGDGAPDGAALTAALDQLIEATAEAVTSGASVIVLSDRGVDRGRAPIPMLLAVGAIHHEMIRRGLRMKFDLVCESGEVWDVHQLACLIGYSASAVHPWLALRAASALAGTRGL